MWGRKIMEGRKQAKGKKEEEKQELVTPKIRIIVIIANKHL